MIKGISPQRMKKIDRISHELWKKYVKPYIGRSRVRTWEMLQLLQSGPLPRCSHPIIRKIFKDGRGMDGFNAAMMTWSYLAAQCRLHDRRLNAAYVRSTQ